MKFGSKQKRLALALSAIFITINVTSCNSNSGKSNNSFGLMGQSGSKADVTTQSWSYTYNSNKLLETAKDPNGNVTRYDYDNEGNLIKITNQLKQTISFSDFNNYGSPQTIIDQNGVTTKLTYTEQGLLHTSTTDGAFTQFDYDEVGDLTKVTLPDNTSLSYVYDGARYLTDVIGADGSIKYTRDHAGNITGTTISGGGVVYADQRVYDEINRLLKITTAISTQSFSYDNDDNLQTITDGRNNKSTFAYDELQRLTQVIDPKNNPTKYAYDNQQNIDNPSSITDAKGTNTIYQYNGLSNLLKLTSPDSGTHNYTAYDGNGNLLQQQDARGNSITYDYDGLNRPKTITYADSVDNTIFNYDNGTNAVGRLTKVQNGVSSNSYYYDARGNTTSEIQRIDNHDYTLRYAYNKADNLTNIVYPSGTQLVYSYNNGQISKVTVNSHIVADITHLPFGPINQIAFGNGVTENIGYNTDYSIKQLTVSNGLMNRDYSYYPNGQIKDITNVGSYEYDQLGALTKADNNSYGYDKVSNRTAETVNGTKTDYTIEGTSNRLLSKTINAIRSDYSYDTAGNINSVGNTSYAYDSLNRLSHAYVDGKLVSSYQYNSFSQRIMKNVDGNKTIFIYNSAGQLLEEINQQQNVTKDYIYADGQLIGLTENGILVYIVADHLNAPQMVLDNTGKSIWFAKYNEFGKPTILSNYKLNIRADGQYQDDETGLYYNWYRYYDPNLGRYITSDPLGLRAGNNTYIYVNGNPINYTDQTGLWLNIVAGMVISGGSEAFSQYLQHGSDFKQWNMTNIAIATAFGVVPAGAASYAAKIGIGWKGAAAVDILSSGVTNLAQSNLNDALSGDCHSAADDFVTFQYGNTYGLMGYLTSEFIEYTPWNNKAKTIIGGVVTGLQQPFIEQRILNKKNSENK